MQEKIPWQFNELKFQSRSLPSHNSPFFAKKSHLKNIDQGNLIKIVETLVEKLNIV